jgi:predicted transcriptional regulator
VECGTYQSPGDFGLRRGKLNPAWWDDGVSQHGELITITIDSEHTIINSKITSSVCVKDLGLDLGTPVTLRIGNKDGAKYIGGFNLFGSKFGDYNLDLEISCIY